MTRDADLPMSNEARSAVANNNHADLFISIHAGYSMNPADMTSSIFLMKENIDAAPQPVGPPGRLFLPWYLGHKLSEPRSLQFAEALREQLEMALPSSAFRVRSAPLSVLTSATGPSLLVEFGNINNPSSAQSLQDSVYQGKLVNAILSGITSF